MGMARSFGIGGALTAVLFGLVTFVPVAADGGHGEHIYQGTCVACHGANGKGTILGTPDFTDPDGPLSKSDEELVRSIIDGLRSPGSAMAMPAGGGNPSMSEADARAVVAYLRAEFGEAE